MPTEQKTIRKLRAILSADVKGYSLLMADDEVHTIQTLKAYRQIMFDLILQHSGRVIDSPGDNLLAEFGSAVDAIECAVDIQKRLKKENADFADDKKLQFRIGINIGDVVQDEDRIYGSGVNIAARIEGLADPGGICISRNAYDHIKDKLKLGYEYLGQHEVKNIKDLVRVYKVLSDPEDAGKLIGDVSKPVSGNWIWAAVVVIAIIIASIVWLIIKEKPASAEIPSIAVLPFVNMSNDPEQEYFSDGMTDELINDLTKISNIFVISRNSAFTYKGKTTKSQQIAKDLNVRYILEGSVQKSGNKVRIRAQLIDGKTDHHLWSESYDGIMDDIFELQDKITGSIVSALAIKLMPNEQVRISDKGTDNILAYDAYLKGYEHYSRLTGDNFLKAIEYYQKAIEIDPNFSRAYASLGSTYWLMTTHSYTRQLGISNRIDIATLRYKARNYLELAMKNPCATAYRFSVYMDMHLRKFSKALGNAEKALGLTPNNHNSHFTLAWVLNFTGRHEEALAHIDKAMKLDPNLIDLKLGEKGRTYYQLGEYEKAVEHIERCLTLNPGLTVYAAYAAASYAFLDRQNEAEKAWEIFEDNFPEGVAPTTRFLYWGFPFKDEKVFNRYVDGLAKAGFKGDPSDYSMVNEKNKLDGQKIKELLFGKTTVSSIQGVEFFIHRSEEGTLEYSIPMYMLSENGKSWIEGDMCCNQYDNLFEGIKFCFDVYSNPDGNAINKNEYLVFSDMYIIPISIKE